MGQRWGNCWTFAVPKWIKSPRNSYLVIRLTRHTWVPHVFFAQSIDGLEVEEFKPLRPVRGGWFLRKFPLHTLIFRGRVRKGKGEEYKTHDD